MAQSESDAETPLPPPEISAHRPGRLTGIERPPPPKTPGGAKILINIVRALLARALFVFHSLTTIWITADVRKENEIWTFALISVSIVIEGAYAVIMRAGQSFAPIF